QHQEGRLEGVVGLGVIAQHLPADAEHHRSVPLHQSGECGLVPPVKESFDEVAVGRVRTASQELTDELKSTRELRSGHDSASLGTRRAALPYKSTQPGRCARHLFKIARNDSGRGSDQLSRMQENARAPLSCARLTERPSLGNSQNTASKGSVSCS